MSSLLLVLAAMSCLATTVLAQVPDSRGRDFWLTFTPNFHNNAGSIANDPSRRQEHYVRVLIASDVPTTGTMVWTDDVGRQTRIDFAITQPRDVFAHQEFYERYELQGFNRGRMSLFWEDNQCELPAPQSVHIVSEHDVSVYALLQAEFTSDAFMVLPTDALGNDYIIMSYPSSGSTAEGGLTASSTPSQFAVLAVEDGTEVRIFPTAPTVRNPTMLPDTVVLMQGESYLVQTDVRRAPFGDLTGSQVVADKPVAVFSGHQRTSLPRETVALVSRDCLVEQMNPVRTWGKRAFLAPFEQSTNEAQLGNDLYRVVARFDSTQVRANGTVMATLQQGEYYEAPLTSAVDVRTSRPAMVGTFKKTSSVDASGQDSPDGDPLLMLVPPEEQFMKAYTFVSVQTTRNFAQGVRDVYVEQFVTVVMPNPQDAALGDPYYRLTLDGSRIVPVLRPIGSSGWSWATISLTSGVHTISADTLFGIYVYGYGQAVSYGYIGGTAYRPLDVYPPTLSVLQACDSITVTYTDSLPGDKGLRSVAIVGADNVTGAATVTFDERRPFATVVASLVNPFADGFVIARGIDDEEQDNTERFDLPGFTVGAIGHGSTISPSARAVVMPARRSRCDSVAIENYGKFPHRVERLWFTSGAVVFDPEGPIDLAPGERRFVRTCRVIGEDRNETDTLMLADSCRSRPAVVWSFQGRADRVAPRPTSTAVGPCDSVISVAVVDNDDYDYGIERCTVDTARTRNVDVTIEAADAQASAITIRRIDPYRDAMWSIVVMDSAGNVTMVEDTIPGFTLALQGQPAPDAGVIVVPDVAVGDVGCHTITLSNDGVQAITVSAVRFSGNIRFSVPPAQFPIVVPPGEERPLSVCYQPYRVRETEAEPDRDTMVIAGTCVGLSALFEGSGKGGLFQGVSRCAVPVDVDVRRAGGTALAVPMPAQSTVTLVVDQPVDRARIVLAGIGGAVVLDRQVGDGEPSAAFIVDITAVPVGAYVATVHTERGVYTTMVVIRP